jgi:hypothetical protein
MKRVCILFLVFSIQSFANDSTISNRIKYEITANTTQFLKQFLSFNNSNLETNPYLVGFRVGKNLHWMRLSYGIDYSSNTSNSQNSNNKTTNNIQNARLGYQYEIPLNKSFSAFCGADLIYKYTENKTISSNSGFSSENSTFNSGTGLGLNLAFQWNISKRIAIYTESYLQFLGSKGKRVVKSSGGGSQFEDITEIETTAMNYIPPTSLFFHLKF